MDKQQKQIEEMAKEKNSKQWQIRDKYCLRIQKAMQYKGNDDHEDVPSILVDYEKEIKKELIPENAVVLTREEYEKVKHVLKYEPEEAIIRLEDLTKNERLYSPHMFCSLGGCSGVRKGCNRTCKESWIVIERKETAEKFMSSISNDVLVVNTKEYGSIEVVPLDRINEICNNIIKGDKQ